MEEETKRISERNSLVAILKKSEVTK